MIRITPTIAIKESEIEQRFIRASGPGGQNVNKVATAVQLRFNVAKSPTLPDGLRSRLISLAGRRISEEGVLVIDARRFRTQERNRQDAINRLVKLLQKAAVTPKPRRQTKPTSASQHRRIQSKRRRAAIKRARAPVPRNEH
ncbi:MAG: aminoacyl-tRNA hydrolase [Gammaproteobacteria bacterium]|nr:aminoacyl-tRNA hydrolase [Gammaproteobacteria bacterium]MCI0591162.1 aminoacyl-tRNA hydrolase [Gammaproteobacteria bacterium]